MIRWGILGPGAIARSFAKGLEVVPGAELVAVGSRSKKRADSFAAEHGIPRAHGSYRSLSRDEECDVIYVASPHPFHMEHTMLCLEAGKAVLCEKPLAVNAGQAGKMIAAAQKNGLFLMEGMWTRFLPAVKKVREWLTGGEIGTPRMLTADFGFRAGWDPEGRLFNPDLGGGALLDVGVYTISLASMIFGESPCEIRGLAEIGETGVDEQSAVLLHYPSGGFAILGCSVRTSTPQEAVINGTQGRIRIPNFWRTQKAVLSAGDEDEVYPGEFRGNGYNYEAEAVSECLRAGKLECEQMPLSESLEIIETMDSIRGQLGLEYPFE